jgi:hypothetical protein
VLLRWPWLKLELGSSERGGTVYCELLSRWEELLESDEEGHDLDRETRPVWVALSVPLAPMVMTMGVHRRLIAQVSPVLIWGAKLAVDVLERMLGKAAHPVLCGVGVGLIPVVPWLALFAFPYWYLARYTLP